MEIHRQFLRYTVIGLVSNALCYLGYLLLSSLGVGHKTAMTIVYCLGVLQTFVFNGRWTFRYAGSIPGSLARYVGTYALVYLLTIATMYVLVDAIGLPHQAVALILILVAAGIVFLMQKFWVFPANERFAPTD